MECININGTLFVLKNLMDCLSYLSPETSFTRFILCFNASFMTADFLVSIDRKTFFCSFLIREMTGTTLLISSFILICFDPGRVDSPPRSIISAPSLISILV